MCLVLLCIVMFATAFTLPRSRGDDSRMPIQRVASDDQATPYRPALRQNLVLFVEDGSGYAPTVSPDWVWDSLLTDIVGAGNFGYFGPTAAGDSNGPDLVTMQTYDLVIWQTYDHWTEPVLTTDDQINIGDFLLGGGKFWLISQDALYTGVPYTWMDTYFHLDTAYEDYHDDGQDSMHIHGLEEINCFSMTTMADYVAGSGYWPDELVPDTNWACHGVIEDTDSMKIVGIFYPGFGDWQSAFWTVDIRDTTFSTQYAIAVDIATGMLAAFGITGVEENETTTPERLQLNISPDPFVTTTTISFAVPNATNVSLTIYNRIGQHVTTLMNEHKQEGTYNVNWNRKDARGLEVPNGVYFVNLTCGDVSSMANVVVAR